MCPNISTETDIKLKWKERERRVNYVIWVATYGLYKKKYNHEQQQQEQKPLGTLNLPSFSGDL